MARDFLLLSEYSSLKAVGYVSGCCFFVKRRTINSIGYLDEAFHPIYCEDSDYCYRAWENDILTVVSPKSIVNHYEGGTNGNDVDQGLKKHQISNMHTFMKLHKEHLKSTRKKIKIANKLLAKL